MIVMYRHSIRVLLQICQKSGRIGCVIPHCHTGSRNLSFDFFDTSVHFRSLGFARKATAAAAIAEEPFFLCPLIFDAGRKIWKLVSTPLDADIFNVKARFLHSLSSRFGDGTGAVV